MKTHLKMHADFLVVPMIAQSGLESIYNGQQQLYLCY